MSTNYKKKLIEVAIPLEAINAASVREKSIRHGHPSTLHLWWARRPLAACRAVLFAQLVDDPSSHPESFPTHEDQEAERRRLFAIIEDLVKWENSTNEEVLERARAEIRKSCEGELPPVYDPFSGGGSIPLEAQRLGLPAYGSDLNPVAVMIGKAMIEIPPKFKDQPPIHPGIKERNHYRNAEGLAEDVKYYGEWMRGKAFERIGHLYPMVDLPRQYGGGKGTVIAWLWARTVRCPNPGCGCRMPLITSYVLSSKKGSEAYLVPEVSGSDYRFRVMGSFPSSKGDPKSGQKRGLSGIFECIACGTSTTRDYVAQEGKADRLGAVQTAVVVEGTRGRIYLSADFSPAPTLDKKADRTGLETELAANPRDVWCRNFGLDCPADLFSERQLIAMNALSELVKEARTIAYSDASKVMASDASGDLQLRQGGRGPVAYSEAISVYLAFGLSKLADYNSALTSWHSGREIIRNTFGRQALPMTWDFAEANPFSSSSGNWSNCIEWGAKTLSALQFSSLTGFETQEDARVATFPNNAVVSTDPPYYDNIGYADLSDFFFCWMKKSISELYPDTFSLISSPKTNELVALPYRHKNKSDAENYFLSGMRDAMVNISSQTGWEYPTTIYYAFKQSEIEKEGVSSTGWATFLQAVLEAGFAVVGTWPLRTEMANRMVASGTNALANSVVLVCRKKEASAGVVTRAEFIRALKRELPPAISELQLANIAPADMPQSAIGPGMGVFSRYQVVLEADDSAMSVKAALQLINRELDEYLGGIQGEFDADTRFTITWFEQHGTGKGDYGVANNIAQARGISVESVKHAGIVESAAGKVRILTREELNPDWDPAADNHVTIWECCQHLIRALETDGEFAAAVLLKKVGSERADAVKDLAYCLYDICSNKRKDAKEATSYNGLIAVWTDLTRLAATIHDTRGDGQYTMAV